MTRYFAFLALWICPMIQCLGALPAEEYSEYQEVMQKGERFGRFRSFSPEKKQRWIAFIRKYDPTKSYFEQPDLNYSDLLALDDEQTGEWLLQQFRVNPDYDRLNILSHWHAAKAVEFIAELCMSDASYWEKNGGGSDVSFAASATLLAKMLPEMEMLPVKVRKWAGEIEGEQSRVNSQLPFHALGKVDRVGDPSNDGYIYYRQREIAQRWWLANRDAVRAGRWQDVKPGENFREPKLDAYLESLRKEAAGAKPRVEIFQGSVAVPPASATSGNTVGAAQGETAELPDPTSSKTPFFVYLSAGVATVVVAGGLVFRGMRKRKALR